MTEPPIHHLGCDRGDYHLDLTLIGPDSQAQGTSIPARSADLTAYLGVWRRQFPDHQLAVCFEQPAANLIAMFSGKRKGSMETNTQTEPDKQKTKRLNNWAFSILQNYVFISIDPSFRVRPAQSTLHPTCGVGNQKLSGRARGFDPSSPRVQKKWKFCSTLTGSKGSFC